MVVASSHRRRLAVVVVMTWCRRRRRLTSCHGGGGGGDTASSSSFRWHGTTAFSPTQRCAYWQYLIVHLGLVSLDAIHGANDVHK